MQVVGVELQQSIRNYLTVEILENQMTSVRLPVLM